MPYLIDSNVVIYAGRSGPEVDTARAFIAAHAPTISIISRVEAFGFHQITRGEERLLDALFQTAEILRATDETIEQAIALRQRRRMSLGDALIAATALEHGLGLATRNTDDVAWIAELHVVNPFLPS